jgi:hypothetical protein
VSPVRYELGFYIPEDDILRSHRRKVVISCAMSASAFEPVPRRCSLTQCRRMTWRGVDSRVSSKTMVEASAAVRVSLLIVRFRLHD